MSDDPTRSMPLEPTSPAPATVLAPTEAPSPAATPRRSSSGRWINVLLGLATAVAIGGIAFAVGRSTAPAAAAGFGQALRGATLPGGSFDPGASFAPGQGGNGPGFITSGGMTVEGTVTSVTGDTLTISTETGQTVEVTLGADTEYHQQTAGSQSDVTTGSQVKVQLDLAGRGQAAGGQDGRTGPTGTASDVTVIP